MDISIVPATADDLPAIRSLLEASGLPTAGVDDHWKTFLVARDGDVLVGCGGAETYSNAALLRSIAVVPSHRSTGLGRSLVRQLIDRLASRGLRDFYLLTTTAEEYFKRRGFRVIDREQVNPQVLASREFQDACPSTATCMRLQMLA
jgi:amino-acid N-acetyltransferase